MFLVLLWLLPTDSVFRAIVDFAIDGDQAGALADDQPMDEATLIEARRKRREAIKAKHRGQATPLLVQALATSSIHTPNVPAPDTRASVLLSAGKFTSSLYKSTLLNLGKQNHLPSLHLKRRRMHPARNRQMYSRLVRMRIYRMRVLGPIAIWMKMNRLLLTMTLPWTCRKIK